MEVFCMLSTGSVINLNFQHELKNFIHTDQSMRNYNRMNSSNSLLHFLFQVLRTELVNSLLWRHV